MAIKGKTKSRSRRVVAIPPKPPVYVRKPPFFRRRAFLVTVAVLVAAGTLTGVLLSLSSSHRKALKSRTLAAYNKLKSDLTSKFPPPPSSQASPPTGYIIYPTLASDLDQTAKGKLKDADATKKAQDLAKGAKASADAIQNLVVTKVIAEEANVGPVASVRGAGATRLELNEGKLLIVQAFRTWESIGHLWEEAVKLQGDDRTAVVDQAKALATQASELFRDGYQKFINVQGQLTTIQPNAFPQAPAGGLGG